MTMSKYEPLWQHIQRQTTPELVMSFDKIKEILGFPIDHSFLSYKKELAGFGYEVAKISLKDKTVRFTKTK